MIDLEENHDIGEIFVHDASRKLLVASTGAYGFVHERRRWKKGHLRNIPPALSSAEMTACFTPRRESE